MSYGIEFIGNNGNYLLDGKLPDFAGIDGGTFSFVEQTPGGFFWYKNIYLPNRGDSFFVACKVPLNVEVACTKRRYRAADGAIGEAMPSFTFFASSNVTIEYRVFWGLPSVPFTDENYGMRVWNESGSLIFDAGHRLFSVIGRSSIRSDGTRNYPGPRRGGWVVIDTTGTTRKVNAASGGYRESYFTGVTLYSTSYRTRGVLSRRTGPWSGVSGLADQGPSYSFMNIEVE